MMVAALLALAALVLGCVGVSLLEWGIGAVDEWRRDRIRRDARLDISEVD
jgi:hypothetical protein